MKNITSDQIKILENEYVEDKISLEDMEDEISSWLEWDKLDGLDARDFEMNYAIKNKRAMGINERD